MPTDLHNIGVGVHSRCGEYRSVRCDVLAFSEKAQLAVTAQFALAALFLCVGEQNQLC